jgi:integrase
MPRIMDPAKKESLAELTQNEKITEWLEKVRKEGTGSVRTAEVYLSDIYDFLAFAKASPEEILAKAGEKRAEELKTGLQKETWAEKLTTSFFNEECKKSARITAKRKYGIVRSFFRAHGLLFTGKTPDATTETAPLRVYEDELTNCWNGASLQEKQALSALRSTGWRRSELVDTKGRDGKVRKGITYGDIKKDLERGEKRLYFERVSKKEAIWVGTFFGVEATNTTKLTLEERKNAGEVFTDETRIFPYGEAQLAQYIRQAAERVNIKITPKTFRKLFRTKCESIIGKDAVYRMAGWSLPGVGKVYNLPPREETLKRFVQIERLVTFEQTAVSSDDARKEAVLTFAKMVGYGEDKIAEMRARFRRGGVTPDELDEIEKALKGEVEKIKHANFAAGGQSFQQTASNELAKILLDALKQVKTELGS